MCVRADWRGYSYAFAVLSIIGGERTAISLSEGRDTRGGERQSAKG